MATNPAQDLVEKKRLAEEQARQAAAMMAQQKDLLRKSVAELDKQIAALQAQRSRAASDLSKLT